MGRVILDYIHAGGNTACPQCGGDCISLHDVDLPDRFLIRCRCGLTGFIRKDDPDVIALIRGIYETKDVIRDFLGGLTGIYMTEGQRARAIAWARLLREFIARYFLGRCTCGPNDACYRCMPRG